MKIIVLERDEEIGNCSKCGAVGGVWIDSDLYGTEEICPDCLIKFQEAVYVDVEEI